MVRVGPDAYAEALQRPHAREMDFTWSIHARHGLRGCGWCTAEDKEACAWLRRGLAYAESLPARGQDLIQ